MPAQHHLHLDTTLSGEPENAPTNKYIALTPEIRLRRAHVGVEWAVDGTMMVHRVTSGGDTVASAGRRYRLKCTRSELSALEGDEGDAVYFVDHYHANDGADHTASVESNCVFKILEVQSREHASLESYYVTIEVQIS